MTIDPLKVLHEAAEIVGQRGEDYGGIENNFTRIADIYERAGGEFISPYNVAMMLASVKMARMCESPKKRDNYIDAINYLAFACELIGAE